LIPVVSWDKIVLRSGCWGIERTFSRLLDGIVMDAARLETLHAHHSAKIPENNDVLFKKG
jgi:hypothetical protein